MNYLMQAFKPKRYHLSLPHVQFSKIHERRVVSTNYVKGFSDFAEIQVSFRDIIDLSDLWIWIRFQTLPRQSDRDDLCDVVNAYYISGKLGGFNSLNLQIFFAGEADLNSFTYDNKSGSLAAPAYFHDYTSAEFKGIWACFKLDLGTADELSIDVLINILIGFSRNFSCLSEIVFGGEHRSCAMRIKQSRGERLWNLLWDTRG